MGSASHHQLRQRLELAAQAVGNTPVIELPPGSLGRSGPTYVKKEGTNPTGSIKDRACVAILREMLDGGEIASTTVLVDASSGNFGTSLAYFGAAMGLRTHIVSGARLTREKWLDMVLNDAVVELHGADTSSALAHARVEAQKPARALVDQLHRQGNVDAHVDGTASEIARQLPEVDTVVCSAGSGGTALGLLGGLGAHFAPRTPRLLVVYAADPDSALPGVGAFDSEMRPPFVDALFDDDAAEMIAVRRKDTIRAAQTLAIAQRRIGDQLCGLQTAALAAGALEAERNGPDLGTVLLISGDGWHKDRSTREVPHSGDIGPSQFPFQLEDRADLLP